VSDREFLILYFADAFAREFIVLMAVGLTTALACVTLTVFLAVFRNRRGNRNA
jgi:hypothetical protein